MIDKGIERHAKPSSGLRNIQITGRTPIGISMVSTGLNGGGSA
jgi:hypothetical protein